jgi:hypothetical protein
VYFMSGSDPMLPTRLALSMSFPPPAKAERRARQGVSAVWLLPLQTLKSPPREGNYSRRELPSTRAGVYARFESGRRAKYEM